MTKSRISSGRDLLLPTLVLLVFSLAQVYEDAVMRMVAAQGFERAQGGVDTALQIGLWLAAAYFTFSVIRVLVLERVLAGALGGPASHLLRDVTGLILLAITVTGIARFVFGREITAFWATSGAVGIVIGLALRPMILDMFSGLTINLDRTYRIGDWINMEGEREGTVFGEVIEINWRATQIKTVEGNLVMVPNSRMGMGILTNYSQPFPSQRRLVTICLDYSIPVDRVRRVLLGGVQAMIHPEGPLADPAPAVLVEGTSELGVVYRVEYWQIDRCGPAQVRSRVLEGMLRHLHAAGITPAYPKRDNFTAPLPMRQFDGRALADRITLMRRIDLFRSLPDESLQTLANGMVSRNFSAGETVVRRGEAGESMFVLMEGLLEVRTELAAGAAEQPVAIIQPGEFIGEMSLLTGEPRTATVRAQTNVVMWEITKQQMEPLLRSDPSLAAGLARTLAERQAKNALARGRSAAPTPHHTDSTAREILGRIVTMFRGVYDTVSRSPFHGSPRAATPGEKPDQDKGRQSRPPGP